MPKALLIRQETQADHQIVASLIEQAFAKEAYSDQTEHLLVARLRKAPSFVAELSLVAEMEGQIVGHILLTRLYIDDPVRMVEVLGLAPVSVLPEYQGQGIGGALIEKSHEIACKLGFGAVVLLGHAAYYPRFGYRPTADFGIRLPFEAPPENCMAYELEPGFLTEISGTVVYPPEFGG